MSQYDTTNPGRKTPNELRAMSEEEAEMWLDADEYDRWERLQRLDSQREETKAEWDRQEQETVETLVKADMGELTTDLNIYGNDISVLVNLDREQRHLMRAIQEKYAGVEGIEDLTETELDALESMLADWLEVIIHEFNGTRLVDLDADERRTLTLQIVEKWGLRATMMAMVDIIEAINTQDQETMEMVEKFRGASG